VGQNYRRCGSVLHRRHNAPAIQTLDLHSPDMSGLTRRAKRSYSSRGGRGAPRENVRPAECGLFHAPGIVADRESRSSPSQTDGPAARGPFSLER
jgi:hypothetical protein